MAITQQEGNEYFLTNTFGDKYLYSLNHNTLNHTGAVQQHRLRFKHLADQKDTLFIVIGSDSGTLIPYLNSLTAASGTRFLVLEPDRVFSQLFSEIPESSASDFVDFVPAEDYNPAADKAQINRYLYAGKVSIIKSLAAEYDFIGEYHDLFFSIQSLCNQQEYLVRHRLTGKPFKLAQLKNIAENHTSSSCLKNTFQGKTAVLLAGGPSLDEILPWVIKNKDSLLVLAVSRISRRLLEIGLTPDIIFSIDPHQVSFDVSKEMLHFWKDSLFIHSYHVSPLLLGQWQGKNIYLGNRFPWESRLNQKSLPMAGPTVSNTALSVAVEMGISQLILAGVDLCHNREGYTHASGSNEHLAGPQLAQTTTQVLTNGGWMAETTSDFLSAIDILALQVEHASKNDTTVINPAPGSAQVNGVQYLPLENIQLHPIAPPAAVTLKELSAQPSFEQRKTDLENVQKELRWITGQLIQIRKLCRQALHCNEGLFGRKGKRQDFKFKKRMDKIERKLNSTYSRSAVLVKEYGAHELLQMTILGSDEDWTDQEIEDAATTYYSKYIETTDQLLELIEKTKQRIGSRLNEDATAPDFDLLFSSWQQEHIPGRLYVWLSRHGLQIEDLPADVQRTAGQLAEDFSRQMDASADSAHMQRSKKYADLKEMRGKILMYFQKKDTQALENLQASLKKHQNPDAEKYLYLCRGLFNELNEQWDQALVAYQQLFDVQDEVLLEDALLRITSISLSRNDLDNSFLALENLAKLAPTYLQQYADLLKLTGSHQQALDTYLSYLEQVPHDINIILKIGNYYRELNIEEGARAMFEHALSMDPENTAAKQLLEGLS